MGTKHIDGDGMTIGCNICDREIGSLTQTEYLKLVEYGGWKALNGTAGVDYCICPECLRQNFSAGKGFFRQGNHGQISRASCGRIGCTAKIETSDPYLFQRLVLDGKWAHYSAPTARCPEATFCLCGDCVAKLLKPNAAPASAKTESPPSRARR